MITEGWNGKSIREHVEHAEADAGRAVEIAEGVEACLCELRRDLDALAEPSTRQELIEALPITAPRSAVSAADRAASVCKVKFIRQEIEHWQAFMVESRGVREAIAEWRRLDADVLPRLQRGGTK